MAKEVFKHCCGECANVTPITDKENLYNVYGKPFMGTCPYWTESPSTLLSWRLNCKHYKPRKEE